MDVGLSGDLGIHIRLGGDVLMDVRFGSRVEVCIGYGGIDSSVNSGHRGSSVSNGLGSHGGGVAISIGTSVAITSISGRDNCGGGRGQTSENSDKGFHVY